MKLLDLGSAYQTQTEEIANLFGFRVLIVMEKLVWMISA